MSNHKYIQYAGLFFHPRTSTTVQKALAIAFEGRQTVRLWYGDTVTGRAWAEEHDVLGKIGRSTGSVNVPLMVEAGESGGPQLLDHCIVRIDIVARGKGASRTAYAHPSFHTGDWEVIPSDQPEYAANVLNDGVLHARFKKPETAQRYVAFMQGTAYRRP